MTVTREVILDLMPVYLAGEASPDTRVLVEKYMESDAELAQALRSKWAENLSKVTHGGVPADLELQSLRRTRDVLARQKWLMGLAIFFTASTLSMQFEIRNGQIEEFHLLLAASPLLMATCASAALLFWILYIVSRQRVSLR